MNLFVALLGMLGFTVAQQPQPERYAVGQVWEYTNRPQDIGSLIKIQQIESSSNGPIYHISMIGVRLKSGGPASVLGHLPVSRQTLDASVTRQSKSSAMFPDAQEGIDTWRRANGGVFTVTLAQAAEFVEQTLSQGS